MSFEINPTKTYLFLASDPKKSNRYIVAIDGDCNIQVDDTISKNEMTSQFWLGIMEWSQRNPTEFVTNKSLLILLFTRVRAMIDLLLENKTAKVSDLLSSQQFDDLRRTANQVEKIFYK